VGGTLAQQEQHRRLDEALDPRMDPPAAASVPAP
jgi:hypothetical protein